MKLKDIMNEGAYDKELAALNTLAKDKTPQAEKDFFSTYSPKKKGTYEVYELDGRRHMRTIGYYKAASQKHARAKAAVDSKKSEVYFTGYYSAEVINLAEKTKELQLKLSEIQNALALIKKAK